jgi:secreted trypsin-like serine protease
MNRRKLAAALMVFAGAWGIPGRARAIVGGDPLPGSAADAIVLLYNQSLGSECSGTLIAPQVVLTAASCLADPTASDYVVLGGLSPFTSALFTIAASEVYVHPDFDSQTFAHDVGVLVLASSPGVTPLPWAATDLGAYGVGLSVSVIGYGITDPSTQTGDGTRRGTVVSISAFDGGTFTTDSSAGHAPCSGDTGGPALPTDSLNGDVVIGVVNYGDQDCALSAVYARTDANAAFISLFAPEPSQGSLASAALAVLAVRWRATWRRRI